VTFAFAWRASTATSARVTPGRTVELRREKVAMTKWEYLFRNIGNVANDHTREWDNQDMNELGRIGWELVFITTGGWAVYKRPLL
jgi:hypothetical protein